jgi:hypothetical protein
VQREVKRRGERRVQAAILLNQRAGVVDVEQRADLAHEAHHDVAPAQHPHRSSQVE